MEVCSVESESGEVLLVSDNVEEMSLIDILKSAPGPKKEKFPELEIPEEKVPLPAPLPIRMQATPSPEKKPPEVEEVEVEEVEAVEEVGVEQGVPLPELATPDPDPSWDWTQVQEHEDEILKNAFTILQDTLTIQGVKFTECPNRPYTVMVGDLTVQNIMLPWEKDPRVTVFKGIRIICPPHLEKRVDAFRRKRKKGPFNFRGLVERVKLRSREVTQAFVEKQQKEETETRLRAFQEKELGGITMPSCLTLMRNEDGSYNGSLTFYCLSLPAVKSIMKFGNKIESQ